jgi:glycosyltransferase involved in cell wall biosynthesis
MKYPLISVIIPVFNCEKYIKYALESIFKQGYPNFEILVINDGSTDRSVEIVEELNIIGSRNIKIISQKNQGPSAAKNTGIRQANGSIIGFLDSDDLWTDKHIEYMLPYLENEGMFDAVKGNIVNIKVIEDRIYEISDKYYHQTVIGAGLYKASVFENIGLFDETMYHGEDADWINRFNLGAYKEKKVNETTLLYRKHENNMTNSVEFLKKGMFDAIRKKIQRERNII